MIPKRTRRLWHVLLVIGITAFSASAFENSPIFGGLLNWKGGFAISGSAETHAEASSNSLSPESSALPLFSTIILNADQEVTCSDNGFTIARFNLCGDFDDRMISVSGSHGSYQWQQLVPGGSCTFDVNEDCPPIIGNECNTSWQTVGSASTFTLSAAGVPAATGAEFRVRVDGGSYYYFKVKKSTITQSYVKRDFICGVPGRIQVTNLSSAYEYSLDSGSGFGPWQSSAIFVGLTPGTYIVKA
ncbi:MAG: hypothetical protein P8X60_08260, partial [Robiginitalea sp.]